MSDASQSEDDRFWIPDRTDGSGWADVDWRSVTLGSRYAYRHAEPDLEARALRPSYYRVVTRLDTPNLHAPHENSYFVNADSLAEFLAELAFAGGDETIWHIEPCPVPPPEAFPNRETTER